MSMDLINMPIDTDPHQQEATSPQRVVVRSSLRSPGHTPSIPEIRFAQAALPPCGEWKSCFFTASLESMKLTGYALFSPVAIALGILVLGWGVFPKFRTQPGFFKATVTLWFLSTLVILGFVFVGREMGYGIIWQRDIGYVVGGFTALLLPFALVAAVLRIGTTAVLICPPHASRRALQSKRSVSLSLPLISAAARPSPGPARRPRPWPVWGTGSSEKRTQCLVIIRLTSPSPGWPHTPRQSLSRRVWRKSVGLPVEHIGQVGQRVFG
jgi:hypothetical protein